MSLGRPNWSLFQERDAVPPFQQLPGALRTGETATYNNDFGGGVLKLHRSGLIADEAMGYNLSVLSLIWPRRITEILVFLGVFLVISQGASFAMESFTSLFGLAASDAQRILAENELFLQFLALGVAGIALIVARRWARVQGWPRLSAGEIRFEFWTAIPEGRSEEAWNLGISSALTALIAVSVAVAVSCFLGFAQLEFGVWDSWSGNLGRLVRAMPDVGLLFVWIAVLDGVRSVLWRGLIQEDPEGGSLQNRLLIVGFEAYVLFRFFNGSPHMVDRVFTSLVCSLIAATFLFWHEFARTRAHGWREDVKRLAFQLGLWGTVFHVYGYPRAGLRTPSVAHVFPGGLSEPLGNLGTNGVLGQALFVLMLVVLVNTLLQRVLRQAR